MRQLLFLSLLACFVAFTNGEGSSLQSEWEDDLYELCPGDEFDYKGLTVNSFLEMRGTYKSDEIGWYAIEVDSIELHHLFNEQEAKKILEIQSTYHRQLVEMFEEKYMNDPRYDLENEMNPKFTAMQTNLTSLKGNPNGGDALLNRLIRKIEGAKELCKLLASSKSDQPQRLVSWGLLVLHLAYVKRTSDENTTMAFLNEKVETIFDKQIHQFDHYQKIRNSKLFDDWTKDYGIVHFRMPLPVQQHNSRYVNKTRPCVEAKKLPPFYQLKGKVDH